MRVSIITPCRNSHEALRRIILYYNKYGLPANMEWIVVDHASEPVLHMEGANFNCKVIRHDDSSPWIIPTLTNRGVEASSGEYIMQLDIDRFVSLSWINFAKESTDQWAVFKKKTAMLDENGKLKVLGGVGAHSSRNWFSRTLACSSNRRKLTVSQMACTVAGKASRSASSNGQTAL